MSSTPLTQFAYRSVNGVGLSYGHPDYKPVDGFTRSGDGDIKTFQYSKNGKYLGWASNERVVIINAETGALVQEISRKNVVEIGFSPKGTYISTWERPVKLDENVVHKNLVIWEVETGKELTSFTQKSQNKWNVQWTEDEAYFGRMVTGEVQFYDSKRVDKGVYSRLKLEGIGDFSLSPGKSPSIAVFIPERKSQPARVQMFSITNFNSTLAQKTFFKADKIEMKWNDLGTNLLVVTHTEVDKTNKSYYGETNLYFLSVAGNYDCRVNLDKQGPIHDVTWSPNSKEFIAIYGFMPAKATLFDHRANPAHEFGINMRNTVHFNPHGRLILIAGFGNLAGTMDVWDRKTLKKISTIEAPNSSECAWSPDGRFLITATLSPRLRVDNGYKIWHFTGVLTHAQNYDELLQVGWRPANVELYPMRSSFSPPPPAAKNAGDFTVKPAPNGTYRPPHARGQETPVHFKREDETSIKSSIHNGVKHTPESLSKMAIKNKKKHEAAKKKRDEGAEVRTSSVTSSLDASAIINNSTSSETKISKSGTSEAPKPPQPGGSALTETEKKIRNITKKLRQIAELKERQAAGDKLEQTQTLKIATEAALQRELQQLKT